MQKFFLMARGGNARYGASGAAIAALTALLTCQAAMAAPVTLTCTFANNSSHSTSGSVAGGGGKRQWVYDVQTQTVDGHRVGETIDIKDGAYNRYFLTDAAIGFSTSTGVRHTVSRVDGSYMAYDANGKLNGRGQCAPAN